VQGTVDGITIVYIGNYLDYNNSTGKHEYYYYAGNDRVAMSKSGGAIYYLLRDYLSLPLGQAFEIKINLRK